VSTLNAIDLIMHDHRELERIFEELQTQPDKRPALVPVMITLLTAHSRAEESEVYPAAAEVGGAEEVEHSQKEHLEADQLAARVAELDPTSEEFGDALQALIDAVTHHVGEEEESVLPGMRARLDDTRLEELGRAFLEAREQHLGDMPADIRKADLEQQAANAGVTGASSMTKDELEERLKAAAEQ
jgi:hemerythrin superfamily protein